MNIIRQTSAALCVCTDEKHGKGSFTQVDAERLLLVAMKKHEIAKSALAELGKTKNTSISRGRVHVGNFVLKTRYQVPLIGSFRNENFELGNFCIAPI